MYLEEKAPGEVNEGITKLSQAIRVGAEKVQEDKWWVGCALGTAATALGVKVPAINSPDAPLAGTLVMTTIERHFKIPFSRLNEISRRHCAGVSRMVIAAELEAEGL